MPAIPTKMGWRDLGEVLGAGDTGEETWWCIGDDRQWSGQRKKDGDDLLGKTKRWTK